MPKIEMVDNRFWYEGDKARVEPFSDALMDVWAKFEQDDMSPAAMLFVYATHIGGIIAGCPSEDLRLKVLEETIADLHAGLASMRRKINESKNDAT